MLYSLFNCLMENDASLYVGPRLGLRVVLWGRRGLNQWWGRYLIASPPCFWWGSLALDFNYIFFFRGGDSYIHLWIMVSAKIVLVVNFIFSSKFYEIRFRKRIVTWSQILLWYPYKERNKFLLLFFHSYRTFLLRKIIISMFMVCCLYFPLAGFLGLSLFNI